MTSPLHAIIPAAGKAKNRIMLNSSLPDAMTIINGKPIIGYIIEDILSRGAKSISVVLNPDDTHTESYVLNKFEKRCVLTCVYNDQVERGPGYSIMCGMPKNFSGSILVYLGDTIYKGPLSFERDFLVTAPYDTGHDEARRWSFVESGKKDILTFIDKPDSYTDSGSILCGLYYFSSSGAFAKALDSVRDSNKLEISDILRAYQTTHPFTLVPAERWYDCGNIDNYYKAKIDFLKLRGFNEISYNDLHGFITKKSTSAAKKIRCEIAWYRKLPKQLQIFAPRLVHARSLGKTPEYSIEFYGYPSLADLFLFESIDLRIWKSLICRLFAVIGEFQKFKGKVSKHAFTTVYLDKTLERLETLRGTKGWSDVMSKDMLTINGVEMPNLPLILPKLAERIDRLYNPKHIGVVHGDLCLSNILFDPASRIFKFIDPRGSFGASVIHGDTKYDIAKMRHSVHGLYDFIVSDLFEIAETKDGFELAIFSEPYNAQIAELFDAELERHNYSLTDIAFIEGLLFLSMIPLHADHPQRQKALYARGLQILNEQP